MCSGLGTVGSDLNELYRERATLMVDLVFDEYSQMIGNLNDYLVHLQTAEDLTPCDRVRKDIITLPMTLSEHYEFAESMGRVAQDLSK